MQHHCRQAAREHCCRAQRRGQAVECRRRRHTIARTSTRRRVPRTMAALPSRAALPSSRSRMVHVSSCRLVCGSIQRTLKLQRVPASPERMRCERQQEHSRSEFCRYQVALARITELYHAAIDIMNHLNLASRRDPHETSLAASALGVSPFRLDLRRRKA